MSFTALMLGMLASQATTRKISFNNGTFVIDGPEGAYSVPIDNSNETVTHTSETWTAKLAGRTFTFTKRGMKVDTRGKTSTVDFTSLAITPKLFSADQINNNRNLIASGARSDSPDAISGWVISGTTAYVLLRWDDGQGKGWLEALVKLSTDQAPTDFTLVGQFQGLTTNKLTVNNLITKAGDVFAALTVTSQGTGVATLSALDSKAGFNVVGPSVPDAFFIPDSSFGVTRESSQAGTTILSVLDTTSGSLRKAAELRGQVDDFLQPSIVKYEYMGKTRLLNLISGSELPVPTDAGIGATAAGVLLWIPKEDPKAAALYSALTFRTLARWPQ